MIFKKASIKHKNYVSKPDADIGVSTRLKNKKDKAFEKSKSANEASKKANRRSKLNFFNTVNATMKNPDISAKKKFPEKGEG